MTVRERASWIVDKVASRVSVAFGPTPRTAPAMPSSTRSDGSAMGGAHVARLSVAAQDGFPEWMWTALASRNASRPDRREG